MFFVNAVSARLTHWGVRESGQPGAVAVATLTSDPDEATAPGNSYLYPSGLRAVGVGIGVEAMGKYTVVEAKRRGQPDSVRVMEVIEVVTITGAGSNDDPVRCLTQYWSTDGMLLAEKDTYTTHSVTE